MTDDSAGRIPTIAVTSAPRLVAALPGRPPGRRSLVVLRGLTARLMPAALVLLAALAIPAALVLLAPAPARGEKPPEPRAGIVPLEMKWVAAARGDELRLDDPAGPEIALAGKRVRFTARVAEVGRTATGEDFVALRSGDDRLVLRLPGPLEDPARLSGDATWEVIARLDRPVALGEGRAAIAVAPDLLIKTPGLPSAVAPGDVIVRVAGTDSFVDPRLPDEEAQAPLYRVEITRPGALADFVEPGRSGTGNVSDASGQRFLDHRSVSRAKDGRERAVRCQFRIVDGKLRNMAWGEVDLSAGGERTRERWVDFEENEFTDKWSARQRRFPPNTYATPCLSVAMAGFPLGEARVVRFFLFGDSGMPTPLYAYLDGEETIAVRGRSERAHRVKLGLDVRETARAIEVPEVWRHHAEMASEVWFAGESTYWIAAEAPHVVLRYRGPLGGPGAPEAVVERTR